jgi:diamine N-acetyltransferase
MLALHAVDESNWRAAIDLSVLPDQLRFVADSQPIAALALAKAYIRPGGLSWLPFAIFLDNQMIGFVMLTLDPVHQSDPWIYHFFIDYRFQGKGLGRDALQSLIELVQNTAPTATGICLRVNPDNQVAQHLYLSAGFKPTGEILRNEPVYRLSLANLTGE